MVTIGKNKKTIYKILRMHYLDNLSQNEIAKRLSISRMKVARFIWSAKEQNLVEIKFNFPIYENEKLETELEKKFNLKECRIISNFENIDDSYKYSALELSGILERILTDKEYVGISWGTTLEGVSKYISLNKKINADIVPVFCAIGSNGKNNSINFLIKNLADAIGGVSHPVHVPAVVDSKVAKETIEMERQTKAMIELNKKISTIILAVGVIDIGSSFSQIGAFMQEDVDYLHSLGVVGILNMEFLNADGERVINKIDDRVVRILPFDSIKKIKNSILISWGSEKVEILKAAIKSRSVNMLITDEGTGKAILG